MITDLITVTSLDWQSICLFSYLSATTVYITQKELCNGQFDNYRRFNYTQFVKYFFILHLILFLYHNIFEKQIAIINLNPISVFSERFINNCLQTNFLLPVIIFIIVFVSSFGLTLKNRAESHFRYRIGSDSKILRSSLVAQLYLRSRVFYISIRYYIILIVLVGLTFIPFVLLESFFHGRGQYLLDFLEISPLNVKSELPLNGNYMSAVLAMLCFIYYFGKNWLVSPFRIFLISSILFFGFQISFYSLINGIYSFKNSDNFLSWIEYEKEKNLITLRITTFVMLYNLLSFVLQENAKFKGDQFYIKRSRPLSYMEYSTIYFAQIGFYILNMWVVWHFVKISDHTTAVLFLNLLLFFIIDDWSIIYWYTKKLNYINTIDKVKVEGANFLMVLSAAFALYYSKDWLYLIIYLLSAALLGYIKSANSTEIRLTK